MRDFLKTYVAKLQEINNLTAEELVKVINREMGNLMVNFKEEIINEEHFNPEVNTKNALLKVLYKSTLIISYSNEKATPMEVYLDYRGRSSVENVNRDIKTNLNTKSFKTGRRRSVHGRTIVIALSNNAIRYMMHKYPIKENGERTTYCDIQEMLNQMWVINNGESYKVTFYTEDARRLFNKCTGASLENNQILSRIEAINLINGKFKRKFSVFDLLSKVFTKLSKNNVEVMKKNGPLKVLKDRINK